MIEFRCTTKEKAVILQLTESNRDLEQFSRLTAAINNRDIHSFASELHQEVRTVSAEANSVLNSRLEALSHFQSHLDTVKKAGHDRFFAVTGEIVGASGSPEPCVVVYDGSEKSCILRLRHDEDGAVREILIAAAADDLERASPAETGPKMAEVFAPVPPTETSGGESIALLD